MEHLGQCNIMIMDKVEWAISAKEGVIVVPSKAFLKIKIKMVIPLNTTDGM